MKRLLCFFSVVLVSAAAFAATPSTDRRSMTQQWGAATRATASKNQVSSIRAEGPTTVATVVDKREKEKAACMANNIGIGNTFVWASRFGNSSNYASLIEDTENPENNICFVRVELKSSDARINVSDIAPVYYEMGRNITCGSWTDESKMQTRILEAKKTGRTWGTVAAVVGGAGLGVGAMELFGNKAIGGKVEGQADLSPYEKLRSQLIVLKKEDNARYSQFRAYLENLKRECESSVWSEPGAPSRPAECTTYQYDALLSL